MADIETLAATKRTHAEGAAAGTPSAGLVVVYAKADGLMYSKDDAGVETLMSSGASLANPMTTAGDIIKGGVAGVAERLAIGAAAAFLRSSGTAPAWVLPPGHEYAYNEFTAPVTISATAEATADTIVTASAIDTGGSIPVIIECYLPYVQASTTSGDSCVFVLSEGGTSFGKPAQASGFSTVTGRFPGVLLRHRLTPTTGSKTYALEAYRVTANWTIGAGAGGSGNIMPGYIRIFKAN